MHFCLKKLKKPLAAENWRLRQTESPTQMPFLVSLAFAADIKSHAKATLWEPAEWFFLRIKPHANTYCEIWILTFATDFFRPGFHILHYWINSWFFWFDSNFFFQCYFGAKLTPLSLTYIQFHPLILSLRKSICKNTIKSTISLFLQTSSY